MAAIRAILTCDIHGAGSHQAGARVEFCAAGLRVEGKQLLTEASKLEESAAAKKTGVRSLLFTSPTLPVTFGNRITLQKRVFLSPERHYFGAQPYCV
jgi:hypothetical protein